SRHLPARRKTEPDLRGALQLAFLVEEQVRSEELSKVAGDARQREIDGVGEVVEFHGHAIAFRGRDPPRVLVEAVPEQRLARRTLRAEVAHIARVVLDFIRARTQRRDRKSTRLNSSHEWI